MADGQQSLEGLMGTIEARTVQLLHKYSGEESTLVYTAGSPDDCPVSRLPLQGNAHTPPDSMWVERARMYCRASHLWARLTGCSQQRRKIGWVAGLR